jgi:hypothetical membrane protein
MATNTHISRRNNWAFSKKPMVCNGICDMFTLCYTGIFDAHDLWHFLSALGIFFMFMFILTLGKRLKYSPDFPWRMPLKLFYTFIKKENLYIITASLLCTEDCNSGPRDEIPIF